MNSFTVFAFILHILFVFGSEEIFIKHAPESVKFTSGSSIRGSQIPEVLSSLFGYTTAESVEWDGLLSGNPFSRPEACIVVELDGFSSLNLDLPTTKYALVNDVEPGWGYQLVADRTYVRFADKNPVMLDIVNDDALYAMKSQYPTLLSSLPSQPGILEEKLLSPKSFFSKQPPKHLNLSNTADTLFLIELQLLSDVSDLIKEKSNVVHDGVPDVYWFRLSGIQGLVAQYGVKSLQVKEALNMIKQILKQAEKEFVKAYDGNIVMMVVALDYQSGNMDFVRRKREVNDKTATSSNPNNLSNEYTSDYPAIFNIILLVALLYFLTIFAVALGMWFMDPGRDSIIYRMTNQRIRKDQ